MVTPTGLEDVLPDGRSATIAAVSSPEGAAPVSATASGASDLPAPTANLFARAGAIVAERAARGGASIDDIERIIARAAAQAARALATTVGMAAAGPSS
jgi:hypothetical protein